MRNYPTLLEEKLKIVSEIDEEILGLCEVKDIEQEIEKSTEVVSRILTAKRKLGNALKSGISKVINEKNTVQPRQLSSNQEVDYGNDN
jgi:hypothetical protein